MTLRQEIQQLQKDNAHWQQQYQNLKADKEATEYKNIKLEKMLTQSDLEVATLTEKLKSFYEKLDEKELSIRIGGHGHAKTYGYKYEDSKNNKFISCR